MPYGAAAAHSPPLWDGNEPTGKTPSGHIGWSNNVTLLNKLDDQQLRRRYAAESIQHGWSPR